MRKVDNIKTETYQFNESFFVDIVFLNDGYDAYLYHINYGIKELMFGCPNSIHTPDEFIQIVENNITDYIYSYIERWVD